MNIIRKISPNFNGRKGYSPEIIVLHIIAGSQASCDNWFANPVSQVSAHYSIGLNGEIHQYVENSDAAWANGRVLNPTFKLYKPGVNPNLYTLSIEHEGQNLTLATEAQLDASVNLIRALATTYNIKIDRDHIIGHYEIFSGKPSCPAVDKAIIDIIVTRAKGAPGVVDWKQKIKDVIAILQSLL